MKISLGTRFRTTEFEPLPHYVQLLWYVRLDPVTTHSARYCEVIMDKGSLSDELSTVVEWYQLGMKLGVPDYKLDEIQRNHPHEGVGRWRVEVLALWLRLTPNASWRNVMKALQRMGENTLAEKIRHKHIRGPPSRLSSTRISSNINCLLL